MNGIHSRLIRSLPLFGIAGSVVSNQVRVLAV